MASSLFVEDISAAYQLNGESLPVFDSVSFDVECGKILGIFGPNGSGKSTLLRELAVHIGQGSPQTRMSGAEKTPVRLGVVPQQYDASFFNWASLLTNLQITQMGFPAEWRENRRRILETKRALDLDLDLRLRPMACSGGMRQQAAIIRAFANDPHVLLADEPFSALDVSIATRVRQSFRRLVQERRIVGIVVLHDLEDIVEICDAVLVIPGRPFTTQGSVGVIARVLPNRHKLAELTAVQPTASFVEIAERILSPTRNE